MQLDTKIEATAQQLEDLRLYIKKGWTILERNLGEVLDAISDAKVTRRENVKPRIYVSAKEDFKKVVRRIQTACHNDHCSQIEIHPLPRSWRDIEHHGLLYLPNPYVVPGGSFNEMYGWDSYFITRGLLRDSKIEFARDMAENHFYQVEMYGTVLNANRTYYLTRSQPPFLSGMALNVFRKTGDREWLARALTAVEDYYRYWTEGPHSVKEMGLSRYYDFGDEPAPEVLVHERDAEGRTHYDRVKEFYRKHADDDFDYDLSQFYDRAKDELTPLFYRADRAMRESGNDPSNRFCAFNIGVLEMLPVDLNCLLYQMEMDIAEMVTIVGRPNEADRWQEMARRRAALINDLMWDAKHGLYFDYHYTRRERRVYPYVTTFFPMWVGIASREQAAHIVENLHLFERAGGLQTSTHVTGNQWDAPMGWAPMQLIAAEGLRRYGYAREADRISINFLSMILKEFLEHGAIMEKYNVATRESNVPAEIRFGYSTNQVGFGWTNAAFDEMYASLSDQSRDEVRRITGVGCVAS
ncbi:MAG TPA: trehalase family glycosidase [Blastocatellia bacterium]|nr:trehalase family glycosidase [Blastocatellia bacterium]